MPAINWTRENGFMLGMAFHNGFIIPKPLEYFVMPFYALGNSDLAGFGRIAYNITPYNNFYAVGYHLDGSNTIRSTRLSKLPQD